MPATAKPTANPQLPIGLGKGQVRKDQVASSSQIRGQKSSQAADTSKADELVVENFGPPKWRTVLNKRADLGMSGQSAIGKADICARFSRLLSLETGIWPARGRLD